MRLLPNLSRGLRGCVLVLLFASNAFAADKWLSIHSKDFLLVGNASESDIRRVGRTLEEFRTAFATMFPKMEQTSSAPTTILVFKNDESFKPFKPLYQGQPANLLAFFQPGEDVNYIAVTATLADSPNVVLHEYAHFLLRENIGGLPLWISEGLAEYYSTFELNGRQNEFTIGRAPEQHITTLSQNPQFIPLKRLLTIQQGSPEYNEESRQGMFYAQSWAMVHYLMLGADGKRRNQFAQLLTSLAKGNAFDASFGAAFQADYGALEDEVREYIRKRSSWPTAKVTSRDPIQVDSRTTSATLSEGEYEYYLGDLLLHLSRLAEAETHLNAAASKAPSLPAVQTSLAVLRVRQKRYDDALKLLKTAAEADSRNPVVNFYYAYVLERADSDAAAVLSNGPSDRYETMRTYATKSIELSPRFVEGYALLSRIDLNAGEHIDEAESMLKKAIAIAPGRDDLQILLAQAYLREDRRTEGRSVLEALDRTTSNPDARRSAKALLDQTDQAKFVFTEISPTFEEEPVREQPITAAPTPAPQPTTPLAPPPSRKAEDTALEALTPIRPNVAGEMVTGMLVNLDCSSGLTLRVRTDNATMEFHSSEPDKIQFLSYTANVTTNIKCGPRNPPEPVTVTYRPVPGGLGDPLVLEFLEKSGKK